MIIYIIPIISAVPVSRKPNKKRTIQCLVRQPNFQINEFVWAYVRGFAYWPGIIESVTTKGQYVIHFFGDYTRAEVGKNRVVHFFEGFEQYSGHNGNHKLEKAIKEASIFLVGQRTFTECMVCKIPAMKAVCLQNRMIKDNS